MYSPRRFAGPALLLAALGIICVNSVISYNALDRVADASAWVKQTLKARQALSDVLTTLLDAETGQRGFLVTSDHRYLAPYHLAIATIQQKLDALRSEIRNNPGQSSDIEALDKLVRDKLAEMAAVITAHIQTGAEDARKRLLDDTGRVVMDEIRVLIQGMTDVEDRLLAERSATYEREQKMAWYTLIIFILTTLALLLGVYIYMRREIRQRGEAALEQERYTATLDRGVTTLERERNEITALNEFGNFLQSCNSLDEVGRLTAPFMQNIFSDQAGALYLYAASRNKLVLLTEWNDHDAHEILAPADCWALRRGQPHHFMGGGKTPVCGHIDPATAHETLCLPLVAQGETLGLLTLKVANMDASADGTLSLDKGPRRRLIDMVVRQLGLALANLRLRETLKDQSIRDPLTNAFNRRYLEALGEKEIAQAMRFDRPLALIMLDVDHFKRFNDLHGHSAGDAALVAVANYLQQHTREGDWLFRYGGEEFVLLLRESQPAETRMKAQELCDGISALSLFDGKDALPRVTISMGIAQFPEHGQSLKALLARADEALYESKQAGRNRITLAEQAAA